MSDLNEAMGIKAVAAVTLIEAYGDLKVRGYLSEPGIVAAAYSEIKTLMQFMDEQGVDALPFDGSDLNCLTGAVADHGEPCGCPRCFHAGPAVAF